jgi:menaquinone-dependent protoporphyrinogen oxidase
VWCREITQKEQAMAILVTYASKHGATQEVAERITLQLSQLGTNTEFRPIHDVDTLERYEAVVMGSAIYYGSWLKEATEFVRHHQQALAMRPVWLFSVGPLGTEVTDTKEQPKELADFRKIVSFRGHQLFFGALDPSQLSFPERMVVKAVRAPEGDFRDWKAIEEWAAGIARELAPAGSTPGM